MKTCTLTFQSILFLAIVCMPQVAQAQLKLPFGKAKPDTRSESTVLSERSGPWLIMCTSFSGQEGLEQARRLAAELSQEHRLKTYIYKHKFDFSKDAAQYAIGWDVVETPGNQLSIRPTQMKAATTSLHEEIAVLVGDFISVDDPRAQKTLKKIKSLQPNCMVNFNQDKGFRIEPQSGTISKSDKIGPLRAAFMLPNPTLPDEYFAAHTVDQFVIDLNQNLKYSLLKNPAIYTVKVATFTGDRSLDQQEIERRQEEHKWRIKNRKAITESKLVDAAKKATLLCRELRAKGLDAYEFHDRHESVVCVGQFDWATQEDASGASRTNQEMVETVQKFKGEVINLPGKPNGVRTFALSKRLTNAGISCDAQPVPVLVPKSQSPQVGARFLGKFR